ncbi:hypothetical protein QBC34DRAFT_460052 [Podospora aff. communis PSN243]|uniref:Carrier domain-containing protein n=1 Tax=Podospora aff. communis PSN243 TaxID=3040156 RepID=A0AAV9H5M3_9PEZI|nr:hypothetical protein QBC34DRAFT_460052 [Podospora aff. communis PSN243]
MLSQMKPDASLKDLLRCAADSASSRGLSFYASGNSNLPWKQVTYAELHDEAAAKSATIQRIENFKEGTPVLLHLQDHWDTILWFWSVVLAGGLPVLSSPFSNFEEHRRQHIQGLSSLLQSPICITREDSISQFDGPHTFQLRTIEGLATETNNGHVDKDLRTTNATGNDASDNSPAFLMLTSGSTGNAKAVEITSRQALAAISGKAAVRRLPSNGAFLNWIGLDHVASLVEIHMQALWLGVDQVHVPPADIVSTPTLFLDLLSRHQISRSFAPNFFLARLVSAQKEEKATRRSDDWDLSTLTVLASGGEANDVATCVASTELLQRFGAPNHVITPGFGMTETCAGAIYNLECPQYDTSQHFVSASLGRCIPGIEMRVTKENDLEVRGDVVFKGYYRNPLATKEAFTSDGWFRTGDKATLDNAGHLRLTGRVKDVININGVKHETADVQAAVDQALGDLATRAIVFPTQVAGAATERVAVAYVPRVGDPEADIVTIEDLVVRACVMSTKSRPLVFALGPNSIPLLPMTSLGKISRARMRALFEDGIFSADAEKHCLALQRHLSAPTNNITPTAAEALLLEDFAATLPAAKEHLHGVVDASILSAGFTSMDLIRLKHRLDQRLGISVPVITLLKNPSARSLAEALDSLLQSNYDPVVTLVPPRYPYPGDSSNKTPLWLVHPGVGEVLVFLNLAHHLAILESHGRPVYALRARGFDPDQSRFCSISETVSAYIAAVRSHQPHGPYALAGYSYGTMIAFEMAKVLQQTSSVLFLGSFNLPPHIKHRMRQLNWNMCLLHLSYFVGLTSSDYADSVELSVSDYRTIPRSAALSQILEASSPTRLASLGLGRAALARWVDVAYGLQSMAVDYEPQGTVRWGMDVFHAVPLRTAAASREEWVEVHLKKWEDFVEREEPQGGGGVRFHAVGGEHYTMIGPEFVEGFAKTLVDAIVARESESNRRRQA